MDISERLYNLISDKLNIKKEEIKPESKYPELGADSLDTVELIMEVEKEFNIKIEDNEMENIITVQETINLINNKLNNNGN